MDISVLLSFAVVSAVSAAVLRRYRPEYAVFAGIAAALAALSAAVSAFAPALTLLRQLSDAVPGGEEYLASLLKCAGAAMLSEVAADICTDCGEAALAKTATLAGRVAVLMFALPIFTGLAEMVLTMINT